MSASMIAFFAFATIAILGSLLVVLKKNPVSSAFALVAVFFATSGLYALVSAHLIAALQILVYTGAIMVLFVFVIMLLNQDQPIEDFKSSGIVFKGLTGLGVLGLVAVLIRTVLRSRGLVPADSLTTQKIEEAGGNLQVISEAIFKDRLFHFELTSFLILGAVIATIALAKRKNVAGGSNP